MSTFRKKLQAYRNEHVVAGRDIKDCIPTDCHSVFQRLLGPASVELQLSGYKKNVEEIKRQRAAGSCSALLNGSCLSPLFISFDGFSSIYRSSSSELLKIVGTVGIESFQQPKKLVFFMKLLCFLYFSQSQMLFWLSQNSLCPLKLPQTHSLPPEYWD